MSEWLLNKQVRDSLVELDATEIEVSNTRGIPDISYAGGWIELKYMDDDGDLRKDLKHFTKEQRYWLKTRWDMGECCWLLLQYGETWFLLDGKTASNVIGKISMWGLIQHASLIGIMDVDLNELLPFLKLRQYEKTETTEHGKFCKEFQQFLLSREEGGMCISEENLEEDWDKITRVIHPDQAKLLTYPYGVKPGNSHDWDFDE